MAIHAGKKVRVYIDTAEAGGAGATWALIAQQDDLSYKLGTEVVDAKTKDDGNTPKDLIVSHNWGGSFGGKLNLADTAYQLLEECLVEEKNAWLKFTWGDVAGTSKEGQAVIESIELKAAGNGVCEYTCSFKGQGDLITAVL